MKARLLKDYVYAEYSEIHRNKELHRILKAGAIVEITSIDDCDIVWAWNEKAQTTIVVDLDEITFDGVDEGYDLRFWNLSRESLLRWFDLLKEDFHTLDVARMQKLITYGINAPFGSLPSGLQALILRYEEFKDLILD